MTLFQLLVDQLKLTGARDSSKSLFMALNVKYQNQKKHDVFKWSTLSFITFSLIYACTAKSILNNLWNKKLYTMYKKTDMRVFHYTLSFYKCNKLCKTGYRKNVVILPIQTTKFRFRLFPGDKIFSQDYSLMYITKILFFSFYQIYLKPYTRVYFRKAEWNYSN